MTSICSVSMTVFNETACQAVRWYREAANQGDADAQSQLGRTILYINPEGSESRHADAAKWLHRAAEKGQPEAEMELGILHARGDGVERDPVVASELFARASESGVDVAGRLVFLRDRQTLQCVAHGECGSGVDRISALGGLALLHDDRAILTLTAMLDNDNPSVRVRAIRALQSLGDGRTAEHLADRLEDESAAVRSAAVTALGALGEADVVESLMEHLDDEDPGVRTSAAKALLRLGEARALPVLRKAAGEKAVSSTIQAAALAGVWRPRGSAKTRRGIARRSRGLRRPCRTGRRACRQRRQNDGATPCRRPWILEWFDGRESRKCPSSARRLHGLRADFIALR